MNAEVSNLCYTIGLKGMSEHRVLDFANAQGDEAALNVLKRVKQTKDHREKQGLRPQSAQSLWNTYSEQYVKKKEGAEYQETQEAERERLNEAYYKSIAEGYQPTREVIKAALADLLALGEISTLDYAVAIRSGLDCVHDMTGVPEPEEASGPLEADAELAEMFAA